MNRKIVRKDASQERSHVWWAAVERTFRAPGWLASPRLKKGLSGTKIGETGLSGILSQDAIDKYDNIFTGSYTHNDVRKKASEVGGACTKRFNQGVSERTTGLGALFSRLRTSDAEAWNGACYALCVFWASLHAQDADFWGWLYKKANDSSWGKISKTMADKVVGFHGALYNKKFTDGLASASSQGITTHQYAENAMLSLSRLRKTSSVNKQGVGASGNDICANIIYKRGSKTGGVYILLSLWKTSALHSGHECAVYVGAPDIAYFDPNYGEFWFPDTESFSTWFAVYWLDSYSKDYGAFSLRRFGVSAR